MKIERVLFPLLAASLLAQGPNLQIAQSQLPVVNNPTAIYTGAVGTLTYCYWVILNFGVGNSNTGVPTCLNNLSPTGSVAITWSSPVNPTGYVITADILRTTFSQFQGGGGCTGCLVAGTTSTNPITDTLSNTLSSYTLNVYNPQPAPLTLNLDNINSQSVLLEGIVNGQHILQPFVAPVTPGVPGASTGVFWIQSLVNGADSVLAVAPNGVNPNFSLFGSKLRVSNSSNFSSYGFAELGFFNGSPLLPNINISSYAPAPAPTSFSIDFNGIPACTFTAAGMTGACAAGGSAGPAYISFRAVSQNTVSGGNFDLVPAVGTLGTPAVCTTPDAGNANLDGACAFPNGASTYVEGHFYASATFVDGVKAQITNWNTTAVTGTATFQIALQCVAIGALASASGYGSPTSWAASTAKTTASWRNETSTLTLTTGCTTDSEIYFYIVLTSGNNSLGAPALLKRLVFSGTGIVL